MITEIDRSSPEFPNLGDVRPPVERLFVMGDTSLLNSPAIAVVGTRRPSRHGERASLQFARELAGRGFVVVSGLAYGIDSMAHTGTLRVRGKTIAVLGHGLDRVYPSSNRALAKNIVDNGGCLVTEFPPGTRPLPHHFPLRNRIIAGLSRGTVVVEAAEKSGSLITAMFALELGREVFVVPGIFDEPSFAGSHLLIRDGATLVTSPAQVLEAFQSGASETFRGAGSHELERIFRLSEGHASLEEVFSRTSCTLSEVIDKLEEAKKQGFIEEVSPQHFVWVGISTTRSLPNDSFF